MTREIKFRAYDTREWKMSYSWLIDFSWDIMKWITIIQYTWLKDLHWKEIYEWDIVKYKWIYEWVVVFWEYRLENFTKHDLQLHHSWWYIKDWIKKYSIKELYYNLQIDYSIKKDWINYLEVIWNIYENKDLLN